MKRLIYIALLVAVLLSGLVPCAYAEKPETAATLFAVGDVLSKCYDITISGVYDFDEYTEYLTSTNAFTLVVSHELNINTCPVLIRTNVANSYKDCTDVVAADYYCENLAGKHGGIVIICGANAHQPDIPAFPQQYDIENFRDAVLDTLDALTRKYGIAQFCTYTSGHSGGDIAAIRIGAALCSRGILVTELGAQGNQNVYPLTDKELESLRENECYVIEVRSKGSWTLGRELTPVQKQLADEGVPMLIGIMSKTLPHNSVSDWIFGKTNIGLIACNIKVPLEIKDDKITIEFFEVKYE